MAVDIDATLTQAMLTLESCQLAAKVERALWRRAKDAYDADFKNDYLWHAYVRQCRAYAESADALAEAQDAFDEAAMVVMARDLAEPAPELVDV